MKGTTIGFYLDLNASARREENNKDWPFAAKLWRRAAEVAESQHRRSNVAFCTKRAEFCDGMARRATL